MSALIIDHASSVKIKTFCSSKKSFLGSKNLFRQENIFLLLRTKDTILAKSTG